MNTYNALNKDKQMKLAWGLDKQALCCNTNRTPIRNHVSAPTLEQTPQSSAKSGQLLPHFGRGRPTTGQT